MERYARRALSPLRAQALAIQDASGRQAILLTADVLGFDRWAVTALRQAIGRSHGLPAEAIMLAASHTHWAPNVSFRLNFSTGGLDVWYRKRFEETLLATAAAALDDLTTGRIHYTSLEMKIGANRRRPDGKGGVTWAPHPTGSYDSHTPVLRVERRGKPSEIILVGHACHPTSSGFIHQWTPDYPGAMRDRLEKSFGSGARAMFVMGCGGEVKVCHEDESTGQTVFSNTPAQARAAGRKLADAVLHHLHSQPLVTLSAKLGCRLVNGPLKFSRPMNRRQLEAWAFDGKASFWDSAWARQSLAYPDTRRTLDYQVQAWTLGDHLTVLGLEGEVCSPLGPVARGLARTPASMTIAYTNANDGYIPSRQIVLEGGYEGDSSHRAYFLPAPFTPEVEGEWKKIVRKALR